MHYDNAIDLNSGEKKKPDIINFYNDTKFGVDALDRMFRTYNCARNIRRCSMVIFYMMLNVSAINGLIVFLGNRNIVKNSREYLKMLVQELVHGDVSRRLTRTNISRNLQAKLQSCKPES